MLGMKEDRQYPEEIIFRLAALPNRWMEVTTPLWASRTELRPSFIETKQVLRNQTPPLLITAPWPFFFSQPREESDSPLQEHR